MDRVLYSIYSKEAKGKDSEKDDKTEEKSKAAMDGFQSQLNEFVKSGKKFDDFLGTKVRTTNFSILSYELSYIIL